MDLNKYWNDVRDVVKTLPTKGIVYLISLDNPEKGTTAGRVMDMTDRKMAARRIVERTHQLASPEEIARFHSAQQRQLEDCAETEQERKGQLAMPKDLQDLVRMAARSVTQDPGGAPGALPKQSKVSNKE